MRRHPLASGLPARQQLARTLQGGVRRPIVRQQGAPPAPPSVAGTGIAPVSTARRRPQGQQIGIGRPEQRAPQGVRQREVVLGRHQGVEQGHHVAGLGRFKQGVVFGRHVRNVTLAQGLRHPAQRLAPAAEHEDVARAQTRLVCLRQPLGNRRRHLARLDLAQRLFGGVPGREQAVAPVVIHNALVGRRGRIFAGRRIARFGRTGRARHPRQGQHGAAGLRFGGVRPEPRERALGRGLLEHAVERRQHGRGVAPGVIAGQQGAPQPLRDKGLCRLEHARLGTPKAVDALLGVAHDEDARRLTPARAAPGAGIPRQPGVQRLPLQRAGVLKFVDQHLPHARIEPLLHPAGQGSVAQQMQRPAFEIVHVGQAAFALDVHIRLQQHAGQPGHADVQLVRDLLVAGGLELLQFIGHGRPVVTLGQLGARGVFLGEQGAPDVLERNLGVGLAQCGLQLGRQPQWRRALGRAPMPGHAPQAGVEVAPQHRLGWRGKSRPAGRPVCGIGQTGLDHARGVGHFEFAALGQRGFDPGMGGVPPQLADQAGVVVGQAHVGGHREQEAPPDVGQQLGVVLQQVHLGRQAELGQHVHRRGAHQAREPAVKGVDLHRAPTGQHAPIELLQGAGLLRGLLWGQAAHHQFALALGVIGRGKVTQPLEEALAHLGRGLVGEGDGQNLLRLRPVEQRPQDPRHQHPRLAGPGAGLDDHAAARIAGHGIKLGALDVAAVHPI